MCVIKISSKEEEEKENGKVSFSAYLSLRDLTRSGYNVDEEKLFLGRDNHSLSLLLGHIFLIREKPYPLAGTLNRCRKKAKTFRFSILGPPEYFNTSEACVSVVDTRKTILLYL